MFDLQITMTRIWNFLATSLHQLTTDRRQTTNAQTQKEKTLVYSHTYLWTERNAGHFVSANVESGRTECSKLWLTYIKTLETMEFGEATSDTNVLL